MRNSGWGRNASSGGAAMATMVRSYCATERSSKASNRKVRLWLGADLGDEALSRASTRPPGGRCNGCGMHFMVPNTSNDCTGLQRCKSARPRGRTGARAAACKHALFRAGVTFNLHERPCPSPAPLWSAWLTQAMPCLPEFRRVVVFRRKPICLVSTFVPCRQCLCFLQSQNEADRFTFFRADSNDPPPRPQSVNISAQRYCRSLRQCLGLDGNHCVLVIDRGGV